MSSSEYFNVEKVKEKMEKLEGLFVDFAKKLSDLNNFIMDNINSGSEPAIFGKTAAKLYDIWDENAQTFGDFKVNFDDWSKMISIIAANNLEFKEESLEILKSKASTLDGVQARRTEQFKEGDTVTTTENNNNDTYEYYDEIDDESTPLSETPNDNSGGSVTYNSGDIVNVGDKTYTFYGAYEKPNGEIVALFEGENESLWYKKADGSFERVQATHTNGSGQKVVEDATSSSLGTQKNYNVHGSSYNPSVSLNIDGQTITSNDISTSITYTGNASSNITRPISNANTGTFANLNADNKPIETDGSVKTSYRGQMDGESVNGSKLITASAMSDFSDYTTTQGGDITLKIPQGQYVQWDSPSGGTGYEFSTANSPVYLRWDSTAAEGEGAYHIVDEYGNVVNDRDFTLDGFNNNGGIDGGVWK